MGVYKKQINKSTKDKHLYTKRKARKWFFKKEKKRKEKRKSLNQDIFVLFLALLTLLAIVLMFKLY